MSTRVQEKFGGTGSVIIIFCGIEINFDVFLNKYGSSFAGVNF